MFVAENRRGSRVRATAGHLIACASISAAIFLASAAMAADASGSISEQPLLSHPFPRGATMFSERPPDETGIRTENRFADPKMWRELYGEFEGGSIGTGIAIGDYDGDGRPDIFVVSKTESCRLFRNLGDWKFEDVTDQAGVGDKGPDAMIWKQGCSFVDVNNDGRLDLYVCRFNAPNLLYVNQGDGTFKESAKAYHLDIVDASVMAAFSDYDRDGWLDVYIATNLLDSAKHPAGQRGYLLHNDRDGTFSNVTDPAGITSETQSHSATWWDYDEDNWPDLYVANDYGVPDKLYHNNRNGSFTNTLDQTLPHTAFYSMGTDLGDVNNDGHVDFYVADMAATSHEKDQRGIADARGRTEEFENSTAAPKAHRSALLINTGTERFLEAAYLAGIAATDWTWSVRFEDLDNDGRLDLSITNGYNRDPNLDVAKRMRTAESPAERIRIMFESPKLVETNFAFRNLGDLEFENASEEWGLDQRGVSFGAAFGDLTGDGNLSLVYSNYEGGVTVLRNDNDRGHRVNIDLRGTLSNRLGIGATVELQSALGRQVRQLTLARGYMSSSEPMVHFGLGDDTNIQKLTVKWPSGHVQTFQDLGVDRRFTITEPTTPVQIPEPSPGREGQFAEVSAAKGLTHLTREEPVKETSVQRLLPRRFNRRGPALAAAPTESGGSLLVIGGTTVAPARILTAPSGGNFTALDTTELLKVGPVNDGPVLLFDANADGHLDLLVTKGGNTLLAGSAEYQPRLYLGNGGTAFAKAADDALPELPISAGAAAAVDFNHDGLVDVFIGARLLPGDYPSLPSSALLANRGGKFEDVTDALAPGLREAGLVTAALWSDVDGDGWSDLLLTLDWGTVKYFHNRSGQAFEDLTEQAGFRSGGTGWWTSLASADFNSDGRPDFVAGNVGLNTQYNADAGHPALLYVGDFTGDGSTQMIEAYHEGEKIYPWRSRTDLSAVIPSILKRYPRIVLYAKATAAEILGEDKLAAADHLAATELRSGVFLSQPNGTYVFQPLPRIAQISPAQGTVLGDFDGDGYADIYLVQNSYSPIPSVGRHDAGLSQLLRGDGHGNFTPVAVADSRLVVPGDAKALTTLDLDEDGWPDFVVSRNNSTTLAFRNHGLADRHSLRVSLVGAGGNPTGIGARITVKLKNGATQTAEVQAGSGYYSQSMAGSFFGYENSNPPERIEVRWPSGTTTKHPFPAGAKHVSLKQQ